MSILLLCSPSLPSVRFDSYDEAIKTRRIKIALMQKPSTETNVSANDRSKILVAKADKAFNPFYPLVVLAGTLFFITACTYGVMTYRSLKMNIRNESGLMQLMRDRGGTIFMVELLVLGLLMIAAMATDRFWQRRLSRRRSDSDVVNCHQKN